jgi:hypothetical protein
MRFFMQNALDGVQDNRGAKQDRGCHRQEFRLETACPIEILPSGNKAAKQKHSAGQGAKQGHADANLFAVRMFGGNVVLKM